MGQTADSDPQQFYDI